MDKHQYEVKAEALNGQIRQEKIRGLQFDVNAEKSNADGKKFNAAIAKTKASIVEVHSVTETVHLAQARTEQRMARLKLTSVEQDTNHQARLNVTKQSVMDTQFAGLTTDLSTAKKMLEQRKELLKQQGAI